MSPVYAHPVRGSAPSSAAFLAVLALTIFLITVIWLRLPYVNGPTYWQWPWLSGNIWRTLGFLCWPLACFLPAWLLLARWDSRWTSWRTFTLLTMLALAQFGFQIAAMFGDYRGLDMISHIVTSADATSYYSDACAIGEDLRSWLSHFHLVRFAEMAPHTQTKPAGPVIFYWAFVRLFGPDVGGVVAGYFVGALTSLGVFVVWLFAWLWTRDPRRRVWCAALYAMLPGLALWLPEFDQWYPIATMLMGLTWMRALREHREAGAWGGTRYALWLGVVLFAFTLMTYVILTMGAWMSLVAFYHLLTAHRHSQALGRITAVIAVGLATWFGLHVLFAWTTGYHPILSFLRALDNEQYFLIFVKRPGGWYVLFDMWDFAISSGMAPLGLAAWELYWGWRGLRESSMNFWLTGMSWATLGIIGFVGLMPGEAARVWLFLQPLLIVPAGLTLSRLGLNRQALLIGAMWLSIAVIKSRMLFIAA
ncbi:conserved membrane hypothetical protein [Desulfovibrionales bacterium]